MDLEAKLDWLYRSPLAKFVEARNELARSLRQSGDREAADRVKALAKPSLTAWTVNQLAFRAKDELDALLEAGAKVRAAHLSATEEQQAAARERRAALKALTTLAESLMAEAGHTMNRAHRQRISRTLEALASRGPDSEEVGAGRLSRDLEPAGFDALTDLAAALESAQTSRPKPPEKAAPAARPNLKAVAPPDDAAERERVAKEERRQAAERERLAQEERRRAAARRVRERRLQEARQAVEALEEKLPELEARRDRTAAELDEARRAEAELAAAALEAEREAREARALADAAVETTRRARLASESAAAAARRAEGHLEKARQEHARLKDGDG